MLYIIYMYVWVYVCICINYGNLLLESKHWYAALESLRFTSLLLFFLIVVSDILQLAPLRYWWSAVMRKIGVCGMGWPFSLDHGGTPPCVCLWLIPNVSMLCQSCLALGASIDWVFLLPVWSSGLFGIFENACHPRLFVLAFYNLSRLWTGAPSLQSATISNTNLWGFLVPDCSRCFALHTLPRTLWELGGSKNGHPLGVPKT